MLAVHGAANVSAKSGAKLAKYWNVLRARVRISTPSDNGAISRLNTLSPCAAGFARRSVRYRQRETTTNEVGLARSLARSSAKFLPVRDRADCSDGAHKIVNLALLITRFTN